jgi:hypothetical protein
MTKEQKEFRELANRIWEAQCEDCVFNEREKVYECAVCDKNRVYEEDED